MLIALRSNPLNDQQTSEQVVQSTNKVLVKFVSFKSSHYTKNCPVKVDYYRAVSADVKYTLVPVQSN